jgi:hypothetical protein
MGNAAQMNDGVERRRTTPSGMVTKTAAVAWAVVTLIAGSTAAAGFSYLAEQRQAARESAVRLTSEERDRRQSLRLVSEELQVNAFNLLDLGCACLPAEAHAPDAQMRALDGFFPDAEWAGEKRTLARYLSTDLWGKTLLFYGAMDSLKQNIILVAKPGAVFPPYLQKRIRDMAPLASSLYKEINESLGDEELAWTDL